MRILLTNCSECGNICSGENSYRNKNTGKILCVFCLSIEKKKRDKEYFAKKPKKN